MAPPPVSTHMKLRSRQRVPVCLRGVFLALCLSGHATAAFAQTAIDSVEIERTVKGATASITLTIHGDGFSTDANDLSVSVLPGKGVTRQPTIGMPLGLKVITATFDAEAQYWPGVVSVVSANGGHDSFRLPAVTRAVLLVPRGSNQVTEMFKLRIEGSGFMEGMGNTKVSLNPPPSEQPTVDSVSAKGTILEASFRAPTGYRPRVLTVTASNNEAIQYPIPAEDEPPDNSTGVYVYRGVLPPKVVSDMFGRRIAKRFIAVKTIITNRNREFGWVIHDLTLDLRRVRNRWNKPGGLASRMKDGEIQVSSVELELLRGVAEKGRTFDPRNITLHILQGAGIVAGGVIGVVDLGDRFPKYAAAFNGPFLAAFEGVFPDHSVSNLNRLNDAAFAPNTLIPRQQARTFVLFVPQDIFLTKKEQERFWDAPTELFDDEAADLDLRLAEVWADGIFIAEADQAAGVSLTQIDISLAERKKAQQDKPEIRGTVVGRNLAGAQMQLISPAGATLTPDGTATDTRLPFILRANTPLDPSAVIQIEVTKGSSHGNLSTRLDYAPDAPVIKEFKPQGVVTGAAAVQVEIIGTGFIPGTTTLRLAGDNIAVTEVVVHSGTRITANIKAEANAVLGNHDLTASNSPNAQSAVANFPIKPPAPTIKGQPKPASAKIKETVAIELTGTNFVPGATKLSVTPADNVSITAGEITATSIKATITTTDEAAAGAVEITVTTAGGEAKTKFTINK